MIQHAHRQTACVELVLVVEFNYLTKTDVYVFLVLGSSVLI